MKTYNYHANGTVPTNDETVFVFGSNVLGVHGAGAALLAKEKFGAIQFHGVGRCGNSYAIPTKDRRIETLPLGTIEGFVKDFRGYAVDHPELKFWVTAIGCGLAGYRFSDIAPLFAEFPENCDFPLDWKEYLEKATRVIRYAGVGSRETPSKALEALRSIGMRFGALGYTLRSGGAEGADSAFESGCDEVSGLKEIWLPWKNFNGRRSNLLPDNRHYELAATVHPYWDNLSRGATALHARNVGQILGSNVSTPVDFVVCYTEDGSESEAEVGKKTGGTGTAIRLASRHGVPVFNLGKEDALERLEVFLKTL
jgi:hypothetical protein